MKNIYRNLPIHSGHLEHTYFGRDQSNVSICMLVLEIVHRQQLVSVHKLKNPITEEIIRTYVHISTGATPPSFINLGYCTVLVPSVLVDNFDFQKGKK